MRILSLNTADRNYHFGNNTINNSQDTQPKKEFIDKFTDLIKNQRDVNDCIAVPRGIFKAYILIMGGAALMAIAGLLPKKWTGASKTLGILGNVLYFLSAIYFAKPFAFKGVSPTVDKETLKPVDTDIKV